MAVRVATDYSVVVMVARAAAAAAFITLARYSPSFFQRRWK